MKNEDANGQRTPGEGDDSRAEGAQRGDARDEPTGRTTKLRLDQFLKLRGLVFTGGEAKMRIQTGEVSVNGELELRRGRGLRPGDRVSIGGMELEVESELFESEPPPPRRPAR